MYRIKLKKKKILDYLELFNFSNIIMNQIITF